MAAEPKSASGRVWQSVALMQAEGASTIHSAEVTSTTVACTVLAKTVCAGRRRASVSLTWWPTTVTLA